MSVSEVIKKIERGDGVSRGGAGEVALRPRLSPDSITEVQRRVGLPLPDELKTLLALCSGVDGLLEVDFTGATLAFEFESAFPHGLPIATDGSGNFWILDITPQTTLQAPLYFVCHDAPVILYQCADLASFLREMLLMHTTLDDSLIIKVSEDRVYEVWRRNPGVVTQPLASNSPDDVLREFASTLTPDFSIVDLRNVEPGMGFSWGRYGPSTEVKRHGYAKVFAYAKSREKLAGTGLFARLFGGGPGKSLR